ncbi:MAG: hypothetical protein JXB49_25420 [Bacteroidales bacterium]|nr:hypothetical protein [Bacteroidales bacterium]
MKKLIKRICRTLRLTKKDWKSKYLDKEWTPLTTEIMDWRSKEIYR